MIDILWTSWRDIFLYLREMERLLIFRATIPTTEFILSNWGKKANGKAKRPKDKKAISANSDQKRKLSYKEKNEFETLEHEINELEILKGELMEKLNSGSGNHEELMNLSTEIEMLISKIEEKENRWLELSELA